MIDNQASANNANKPNIPTTINNGSTLNLDRSNFFYNIDSNYKALRSPNGLSNTEGFDFTPKQASESPSVVKSDKSATITNGNLDVTGKNEVAPGTNLTSSRHSSVSNSSFQSFS